MKALTACSPSLGLNASVAPASVALQLLPKTIYMQASTLFCIFCHLSISQHNSRIALLSAELPCSNLAILT